ncbi:UDP-2,3-diacylglucosamine diphosphatase [Sinimarinibacterium sp. CAU 1509]|uniref:UDP-2,3-diacylglucosamine diphosphatase n=1 Tax=Sinimarinibacterium sp. CAU 1509 TaxID=2562283 RepID=UPI0010AC6B5B|nr:UDP-2,3-diacylglucosamine diphosphatase [Sinimarinibacterium sp. CAU 1509]TJY62255.1 UDP-2,3-diacylglucosamine diphosphatase [Sinimarinibacterium sp. CAU 1509]
MTQRTLFVSDLHLPNGPSPLRDGLIRLLDGPARATHAVYLLGDIFEYWIGDDVGLRDHAPVIDALRALNSAGVAIYAMHGNRDFLYGRAFERASGVQLLTDPTVVDVDGVPTLLSHGDLWCTDDHAYQRWRRFSRNRFAQWVFLKLPQSRRLRIAGGLRGQSADAKQTKSVEIMDVNPLAVEAAFRHYGVSRIIHGHTHRPADHRLSVDGREVERIVLADWHADLMEYLVAEHGHLRRMHV